MASMPPSLPSTDGPRDRLGRNLHDLRISVTDRCNLRCTYCMPEERYHENHVFLPREELLRFEEIAVVARAAATLGVSKLRITGGEPLLRRDLPRLVEMLGRIPGIDDIALTTNGLLLPALAPALRAAGLRRVTVSLDSLDDRTLARLSGRPITASTVISGIEAAQAAGFSPVKVNAVIQRGVNDTEILPLVERFRGSDVVLRFIEFMDVGTMNGWERGAVVPAASIRDTIHARYPLVPDAPAYRGEVASRYRFSDGRGEVGFITSVSQPFCRDCTRLRLAPDGALYTCLFAQVGHPLRELLRGGADVEEVAARIAAIWRARADRYSELRTEESARSVKVEMFHIGG